MGYTKQSRGYNITPRRKPIVKTVAKRSKKSVTAECMKDVAVKKYVLKQIGKEVRAELKKLSSEGTNSILQQSEPNIMETFTWETLHSKLTKHTPVLQSLLQFTGSWSEQAQLQGSCFFMCGIAGKKSKPKDESAC